MHGLRLEDAAPLQFIMQYKAMLQAKTVSIAITLRRNTRWCPQAKAFLNLEFEEAMIIKVVNQLKMSLCTHSLFTELIYFNFLLARVHNINREGECLILNIPCTNALR